VFLCLGVSVFESSPGSVGTRNQPGWESVVRAVASVSAETCELLKCQMETTQEEQCCVLGLERDLMAVVRKYRDESAKREDSRVWESIPSTACVLQ